MLDEPSAWGMATFAVASGRMVMLVTFFIVLLYFQHEWSCQVSESRSNCGLSVSSSYIGKRKLKLKIQSVSTLYSLFHCFFIVVVQVLDGHPGYGDSSCQVGIRFHFGLTELAAWML